MKVFKLLLTFILAALFFYSGCLKLLDWWGFADNISAYRLLPPSLINATALILPCFEITLAVSLCWQRTRPAALTGLIILCSIFIMVLLQALARGLIIDCGCFGKSKQDASLQQMQMAIVRNLLILTACFFLKMRAFYTLSKNSTSSHSNHLKS
jgi:Methylamine utilisation protein MauE